MKPDKDMKLADLMYGHEGNFICHLSGRYSPDKYLPSPSIQICEMDCGCWVVADGNNRIGLILRKNPDATIGDIPDRLLTTSEYGEWDSETMGWWNPCPKAFREVMTRKQRTRSDRECVVYGMVDRCDDGTFFASTMSIKSEQPISSYGTTLYEAEQALEQQIRSMPGLNRATLVLTPLTPLHDHICYITKSAIR